MTQKKEFPSRTASKISIVAFWNFGGKWEGRGGGFVDDSGGVLCPGEAGIIFLSVRSTL